MNEELNTETITLFGTDHPIADKYEGLITIRELKEYLPNMESELYSQLRDDIKANGMHDPILYYELPEGEKLVLEGHTRLEAAIELDLTGESLPIKPIQEQFSSINDVKLWMLRHQFQRRNLSAVEKLRLAMLSKDTIEAKAKENLSKAGKEIAVDEPIDTAQEVANLAGVGRSTAVRYMTVFERGSKQLKEKLNNGEISIFDASKRVERQGRARPQDVELSEYLVNTYEDGKDLLSEGSIKSLIIIKDQSVIKFFSANQRSECKFWIIND